MRLKPWWEKYERFFIVRDDVVTRDLLNGERCVYGYFPENRNSVNALKNLWLAWKVLRREKPDMLFSLGAGIAPPFYLVAKFLGIKTVFMETFMFIPKATLSGKMIYPLADNFLVQHPDLLSRYPKAAYRGSVL
jgi:beta-1,4-N-acetylglucosaminyltransferase